MDSEMNGKMANLSHGPADADAARRLFRDEGLPFPPVPDRLSARLRQAADFVFATAALQRGPYDLAHHAHAFEDNAALADQVVLGFDGHGVNSWAVHYHLVCDGLGLFVQLPWGGAFIDEPSARQDIIETFRWAAELQTRMARAREGQCLPAGRRLEVLASRLRPAGWRWLDADGDPATVPWQPAAGMKATLIDELDAVLAGGGAS